jgi:hypothetical protein
MLLKEYEMHTRYSAGAMGEIANLTYDFSYLRRDPVKRNGGDQLTETSNKTYRNSTYAISKDVHEEFNKHWSASFSSDGMEYQQYEPAYRFGFTAASHPFYNGYSWTDAEPSLKLDWADEYTSSKWEQFKAAIRAGWDLANR